MGTPGIYTEDIAMAQTGYTPILLYSSTTAAAAPTAGNLTNSALGSELAINITDGKLFYKDNANVVQVIAWKTTPTTAGGTGLTSYTAGDLLYYATGSVLSKLGIGASGNYLSSSGSAPQWSAPAALTKTDDTNVTLTLGGSASTALLNAASLTLGWTGQLAVTRGGTGLSTVAQGDILYGSASNTLAALAKNTTATRYLSNTGSSNNPAWAQVDLSNGVTGTLPVGNGGTGATSFTANRILLGNGTSAFGTIAVPVSGSVVVSDGTTFTTNTVPSFSAYRNTGQSFTSLVNTKVQFDNEDWDTASCYDPTTNYRFTPNVAGYYQVNAHMTMASSASYAIIRIVKNGTNWKEARTQGDISVSVGCEVYLNGSTDYIEVYLELVTGQNNSADAVQNYFQGTLVRGA